MVEKMGLDEMMRGKRIEKKRGKKKGEGRGKKKKEKEGKKTPGNRLRNNGVCSSRVSAR